MMKNWMMVAALVCAPLPALAQTGVIDATTAGGERVRLLPDGRWEWIDGQKAAAQKQQHHAHDGG